MATAAVQPDRRRGGMRPVHDIGLEGYGLGAGGCLSGAGGPLSLRVEGG